MNCDLPMLPTTSFSIGFLPNAHLLGVIHALHIHTFIDGIDSRIYYSGNSLLSIPTVPKLNQRLLVTQHYTDRVTLSLNSMD